ncbi:hypothetical protein [Treponema sp. R8-4-B8]
MNKGDANRQENIIGIIKNIKEITNKDGEKMAFAILENNSDEFDLTFYSKTWAECCCQIENGRETTLLVRVEYKKEEQGDRPYFVVDKYLSWLDNYNYEALRRLYKIKSPIDNHEKEEYRSYFEYANKDYPYYGMLNKYLDILPEFLISNYGKIIINGKNIESTLVKNGPNKGYRNGDNDHYREIIFPNIALELPVFTYRLVAEVWCNNPDIKNYTTVHHIGHDGYDIKNNLLFVTNYQHGLIHGWNIYEYISNETKKDMEQAMKEAEEYFGWK